MVPEVVDNAITSLTNTTLNATMSVERRLLEQAFVYIQNNRRGGKPANETTVKKPTRIRGIGPVSNPSTESFRPISDKPKHRGLCVYARHRVSTQNPYTERLLRPTTLTIVEAAMLAVTPYPTMKKTAGGTYIDATPLDCMHFESTAITGKGFVPMHPHP